MVLSPGTNSGAKVTTIQGTNNGEKTSLCTSPIIKSGGTETIGGTHLINTIKSPLPPSVTNNQPSSILQVRFQTNRSIYKYCLLFYQINTVIRISRCKHIMFLHSLGTDW